MTTLNKQQEIFKETLINALRSNICFIEHMYQDQHVERPYTLHPKGSELYEMPDDLEISQDLRMVTMWDIFDKKYVQMNIETIPGYTYESDPENEELIHQIDQAATEVEYDTNNPPPIQKHAFDRGVEKVSQIERDVCDLECIDCDGEILSREKLISYRCNWRVVRDPRSWIILKLTGFAEPDISKLPACECEETLARARQGYMNQIRLKREESFKELDQLEEEARSAGSTDEDLADIDTIKQMFRDIPQDTDLSSYKSMHELMEFWPSLLLPQPKLLDEGHIQWLKGEDTGVESGTMLDDIKSLLQDVDDVKELEKLYTEIISTGIPVPPDQLVLFTDRIAELKTS